MQYYQIHRNKLFSLFFVVLFFFEALSPICLSAAPRRYSAEEDNSTALREMRDSIDTMRHEG